MDEYGPFDAQELLRWAETYGHPEEWAKKAQSLHAKVERLTTALQELVDAPNQNAPLWVVGEDVRLTGLGTFRSLNSAAEALDAADV